MDTTLYHPNVSDGSVKLLTRVIRLLIPRRVRKYPLELVVAAILHRVDDGCKWRSLDSPQLPWHVAYDYFRRWARERVMETANAPIVSVLRFIEAPALTYVGAPGPDRNPGHPTAVAIDSRSVPAAAWGRREVHGYDGYKRVSGVKLHACTDSPRLYRLPRPFARVRRDGGERPRRPPGRARRRRSSGVGVHDRHPRPRRRRVRALRRRVGGAWRRATVYDGTRVQEAESQWVRAGTGAVGHRADLRAPVVLAGVSHVLRPATPTLRGDGVVGARQARAQAARKTLTRSWINRCTCQAVGSDLRIERPQADRPCLQDMSELMFHQARTKSL